MKAVGMLQAESFGDFSQELAALRLLVIFP